jgi:two-component system nitrate/nitrite response regulator NarL
MSANNTVSILLLEDQGLVRAGMRELIQIAEPRAQIKEAGSFEEAVALAQGSDFDLAFLDHDLRGDKTGVDFLKWLRASDRDTRAVMLSGRADKEIVLQCLAEGASGYILKDLDGDGLFRRALDTVFQGSVFLPDNVLGRGGFSPAPTAGAAQPPTPESLGITGRTLEALYWACQGLPNKSIARHMGIEAGTVQKDYMPKLFRIFKVVRRTELMVEVARRGMTIPAPQSSPEPAALTQG